MATPERPKQTPEYRIYGTSEQDEITRRNRDFKLELLPVLSAAASSVEDFPQENTITFGYISLELTRVFDMLKKTSNDRISIQDVVIAAQEKFLNTLEDTVKELKGDVRPLEQVRAMGRLDDEKIGGNVAVMAAFALLDEFINNLDDAQTAEVQQKKW